MNLSLAISPCPNDTFSFHHILHHQKEHSFNLHFLDIEELNKNALKGSFDITKVSFGIIPLIAEEYEILDAGAALGFGCGPLLIAKTADAIENTKNLKVLIPGKHTTANLLLSGAFPQIVEKEECVFSEIEAKLLHNEADAGLIIHENRFTYASKGLVKIVDLGEWWEAQTAMPVPLGCIVIKRNLPFSLKKSIEERIKQSIQCAFSKPDDSIKFVSEHAQEMDTNVMRSHIELYVNEYSISLGERGRAAVHQLLGHVSLSKHSSLFL
ncbi:MAG: 1,4-dihydroxy-6-naphthoate synthase [Bacteroidia bacterium]